MMDGSGRTASSGVRDSYYGIPVIKAPHWRWLVIAYFFLGGIAGAAHTIATLAHLVSKDRAVERVARYVSWAAFVPGPILLILDLGQPERALNMFRIVKLKSPMSLGSWALLLAGVASTLGVGLHLLSDLTGHRLFDRIRWIASVAGLPFSVFLSGYTGVLLAATNIPLWWRASPFLSPVFISSAYSSTLATMTILLEFGRGEWPDRTRRMARAETAALAVELVAMTAAVIRLGRIGRPLTTGRIGMIFWPVTYFGGLVIPLILQLNGPVQGAPTSRARRIVTALLAVMGGFSLRTVMIFAGRESANRPEDYFAMTGGRRSQR
jgi:formate-dependent nitrite reductase membrane component NrfD